MSKKSMMLMFSLFLAIHIMAQGYVKRFSISFKNEPMSFVFKKIGTSSGVRVEFAYEDVNSYNVTAKLKNVTAEEAVKSVISNYPLTFSVKMDGKFIVVFRQRKTPIPEKKQTNFLKDEVIKGKVVDKINQPLIGVSIVLSGSKIGTMSDDDGNFSIQAPSGKSSLIFSYIGMKRQTIVVNSGSKNLVVRMEDNENTLNNVIVTAIGKTISYDKSGITASVFNVDKIKDSGSSTLLNDMAGKVSGVKISSPNGDPGSGSTIVIRGANTFLGDSQPLVIIDGVPMSNSYNEGADGINVTQQSRLNDIDPNDIESLQILKGASAAAMWGSQAANGVIVITTKSGLRGMKPTITYSYTKSFDKISSHQPLQSIYGQGTGGKWSGSSAYSWGDKISDRSGGEDIYDTSNGYFIAESGKKYYPIVTKNSKDTFVKRNFDDVIGDGTYDQHDVSISGGNDKATYFFSYGSLDQNGIIKKSTYKKQNFRLNTSYRFNNWIKMNSKVTYINTRSNRVQTNGETTTGVMLGLLRTPADFDIRDYKGTYVSPNGQEYPNRQRMYRSVIGAIESPTYSNPLWVTNEIKDVSKVNRFIFGQELLIDPLSWLNITLRGGLDYFTDNRNALYPTGTATYNGRYIQDVFDNTEINFDGIIRATKSLSKNILLTGTVGYNINDKNIIYNDNVITPFEVASSTPSTSLISNNSYSDWNKTITHTRSNRFYILTDFELFHQIYFSSTGMWEVASTIPKTYFYPSSNISWIFNNYIHSNILSFGKIRASWGKVGNQPEPYKNKTLATTVNSAFGGSYAVNSEEGNNNLKPEIKTEWEVGTDLRFFNDRTSVKLTYYKNNIKDLLFDESLNSSTGYSTKYANAGRMENHGIEADISCDIIKNKDWDINIGANFNNNKNKVTSLGGTGIVSLLGSSSSSYAVVGRPMGALYRPGSLRDSNGKLILNSNGFPQLDPSGSKYIGNPTPEWRGGITLNINYKKFDFSIQVDHSQGGKFLNRTLITLYGFGTHRDTAHELTLTKDLYDYAGILYKAGTTVRGNLGNFGGGDVLLDESWYNGIGGGLGTNKVNDLYMKDNSWTKLRNISIGYTLENEWLRTKARLKSIKLSVTGRDLYTWSKQIGIDPESNYYGVSSAQGMDYFSSPTSKSVLFNIQIIY
jgi:TonB-linked SusC/RagA family outer membrane protein